MDNERHISLLLRLVRDGAPREGLWMVAEADHVTVMDAAETVVFVFHAGGNFREFSI